jgi:tRNA (adenine57-N1/adenine58-N1)-methyltransferase
MSMALLRAGADVVGYELREDFANHARSSVESALGGDVPYRVELRDVYEGIAETALDRIVLDLPEPWRVLPHAERALRSGGILCAYLPSINQTSQLRNALETSAFGMAETLEVLHRTWHVEARSVRPDHRMVGHTGFITTARLLVPGITGGDGTDGTDTGSEEAVGSATDVGPDGVDAG